MATTVSNVRFVRCPKCLKLLAEFSDVPVYVCGGCGTTLRAKSSSAAGESVKLGSVENNAPQNVSDNGFSNTGSVENTLPQNLSDNGFSNDCTTSMGKQMISCSSNVRTLEVNRREEQTGLPNLYHSYSNAKRNCHEMGESSKTVRNGIKESGSGFDSPKPIDQFALRSNTSFTAECLNKEVERSLKLSQLGSESLTSSKKMEDSTESISHSEEDMVLRALDDRNGDNLRSNDRSSHVYDGSVSSSDNDTNGCVPDQSLLLSKRTLRRQRVSFDTKRKEGVENVLGDDEMTTNAEALLQAQKLLSKSLNGRYTSAIMRRFDSSREELYSRYGATAQVRGTSPDSEDFHPVQNWMESEKDVYSRSLSRGSLFHGDSLNYQNGSSSTKFRYPEHDRTEVLRKVDELRDQLSGLYDQRGKVNRRPYTGSIQQEGLRPSLFNHKSEQQLPQHLRHPPEPYWPRKNVPQQSNFSQLSFPEHPYCSCLNCHPQNSRFSTNIYCKDGLCRTCPFNMCCSHKAQTHNHELEKLHCKEKRKQPTKRHFRPVSGGAPFVICYKCFELLQLPVDFLVSRRRLHKLQCSACSEVLVFSFRDRPRRVPQTPTEVAHPPSEVENCRDSHSNDCPQGYPVSYTEEYGLSFSKSYSTEGEPVLHVSRNSPEKMEEINGERVSGSPLHRLMGYSSASELIHHPGDVDEGYESTEPTKLDSHRPLEERHLRSGSKGIGTSLVLREHSAAATSSKSMQIHEEDELPKKLRTRTGGSSLHGFVKKGMQEMNLGSESMKLKARAKGKVVPAQ